MSKTLKKVAIVAGAVALVATGVGAVAGAAAVAATAAKVATIATAVSTAANIGAQITAPKPTARGSITDVIIAAEPPRPCLLGETYFAGVVRDDKGYGATIKKVPNPYRWLVTVHSGVGPVEALVQEQFDFQAIGSYYTGFYGTDTQLGARPEASALVPPLNAPATGWDANSKLSGCAAIGWNFLFDKDGKVFASGLPQLGAIWKGVKCYDPRLDDTFPGGVGSHRLGDESTYTYTTNPALHAGTYLYGRYENGKLFFGVGIASEGIDWQAIADWANTCDANSWEVSGVIFEGGDQNSGSQAKAANLDDICAAGGARWLTNGAVISFDWHRPRVPLATITDADIMEAGGEIVTLQTHRDRFNIVRPQYTSQAHNWQLITGDPISNATYITEDGEERPQSWPFNLVKDNVQAGQLATYAMADSREIGPIRQTLGPEWRFYGPGDCLRIESDISGFTGDAVILDRSVDFGSLEVSFTLKGETNAKHAYALGESATSPATPIIGQTGEERDDVAIRAQEPVGYDQAQIRTVSFRNPRDASDVARKLIIATEASASVTISIAKFDADYIGVESDATFGVQDITTLNDGTTPIGFETRYYPYMDYNPLDPATAPVYGLTTDVLEAQNSADNPLRHAFGAVTTPASGSGGTSDGTTGTGGGGGLPPDEGFE